MNLNSYLPAAGQLVKFDPISIVFLAIIALFAIIFFFKGFLKALFGVAITVGSLVAATLLCKPLSNFVFFQTPVGNLIFDPILRFVAGFRGGALNVGVSDANANTVIPQALADLGIPDFLTAALTGVVRSFVEIGEEEVCLANVISFSIAFYALVALSFAIITAVVAIVLRILEALLLKLTKKTKTGWINRLLGLVLGGVVGLAISAVLAYLLIFVINMENGISTRVANWIAYSDNGTYTIAKGLMAFMNDIVSIVFKK